MTGGGVAEPANKRIPRPRRRSPREPAYLRIERHLRDLLDEGGGVTESLPSEVALAQQFGVSVMTVRQAYARLVHAGAVARVRFKGTFAAAHLTDELVERLSEGSYLEKWRSKSSNVTAEVVEYGVRAAPRDVADAFGIPADSPLTYLCRRRRVNNQPVAWDIRWLPVHVAGEVASDAFERLSVYAVMAQIGLTVSSSQSDITARASTSRDRDVLECDESEVLLEREVRAVDADGVLLLLGRSTYPASRFSFRTVTSSGARAAGEGVARSD